MRSNKGDQVVVELNMNVAVSVCLYVSKISHVTVEGKEKVSLSISSVNMVLKDAGKILTYIDT